MPGMNCTFDENGTNALKRGGEMGEDEPESKRLRENEIETNQTEQQDQTLSDNIKTESDHSEKTTVNIEVSRVEMQDGSCLDPENEAKNSEQFDLNTEFWKSSYGSEPPENQRKMCLPDRCNVCSVDLQTTSDAETHYRSPGHAKKSEPYLAKMDSSSSSSLKAHHDIHPLTCDLCSIRFPNYSVAQEHYSGNDHITRIEEFRKIEKTSGQRFLAFSAFCSLCKVPLQNEREIEDHFSSPDHVSKIKNTKAPETAQNSFACSICNLNFPTEDAVKTHFASQVHMNTVGKSQTNKGSSTRASRKPVMTHEESGFFNHQGDCQNQLGTFPKRFACLPCGFDSFDEEKYNGHMVSLEHHNLCNAMGQISHTSDLSCQDCKLHFENLQEVKKHQNSVLHQLRIARNASNELPSKITKKRISSDQNIPRNYAPNVFICEICTVECSGAEALEVHKAGKAHKRRVDVLSNQQHSSQNMIFCSICSVQVCGHENYNTHISGKKHMKMAKKLSK